MCQSPVKWRISQTNTIHFLKFSVFLFSSFFLRTSSNFQCVWKKQTIVVLWQDGFRERGFKTFPDQVKTGPGWRRWTDGCPIFAWTGFQVGGVAEGVLWSLLKPQMALTIGGGAWTPRPHTHTHAHTISQLHILHGQYWPFCFILPTFTQEKGLVFIELRL